MEQIKNIRVTIDTLKVINTVLTRSKLSPEFKWYQQMHQFSRSAGEELMKAKWQLGLALKELNVQSPYNKEHTNAAAIKPTADVTLLDEADVLAIIVKDDIVWHESASVNKIDYVRKCTQDAIDTINADIKAGMYAPVVNRMILCIRHLEYAKCYYGEILSLLRDEYNTVSK